MFEQPFHSDNIQVLRGELLLFNRIKQCYGTVRGSGQCVNDLAANRRSLRGEDPQQRRRDPPVRLGRQRAQGQLLQCRGCLSAEYRGK
jgi:hypothetical protein